MTNQTPTPEQIEAAARAMALVDDYDGCFERLDGTDPEEPLSTDAEDAEFWRKRAEAGLAAALAAAPSRPVGSVAKCQARRDDEHGDGMKCILPDPHPAHYHLWTRDVDEDSALADKLTGMRKVAGALHYWGQKDDDPAVRSDCAAGSGALLDAVGVIEARAALAAPASASDLATWLAEWRETVKAADEDQSEWGATEYVEYIAKLEIIGNEIVHRATATAPAPAERDAHEADEVAERVEKLIAEANCEYRCTLRKCDCPDNLIRRLAAELERLRGAR